MIIEIINAAGDVFTKIDTADPEKEFAHAREMYGEENAASWRKYVPPPRTPEQAAVEKRAAINAERDRREAGGFEYLGKRFDSDGEKSVPRILGAVVTAQAAMLTGGTFTVTWTCADNSTIDLTEQQLLGLAAALAAHSDALHQTARALKAAVDAALEAGATAEEIDALPVWED